jgi:ectoine hydrolase
MSSPRCEAPHELYGRSHQREGLGQKTIGVETDAYYYTARSDAELKKTLGKDTLVDANLLVNWVRIIKSEAEIALMSQAGKIAEKVMATALENLVPGRRECDAVAAVLQAQASGSPGNSVGIIRPSCP